MTRNEVLFVDGFQLKCPNKSLRGKRGSVLPATTSIVTQMRWDVTAIREYDLNEIEIN